MRKVLFVAVSVIVLVTCAAWLAVAADDNEGKIPLAQVPAAARKAALKAVPGATFDEAYKEEDDDGKVYFELDGQDTQGRDITVEVTAAGKILSIATEIELAQVPKVVMTALRKKLKDFKPASVMAVREEGEITEYAFEGKDGKGEEMNVTVSADGSEVEVDEDP
jgi:uncharacterized protein YxeA